MKYEIIEWPQPGRSSTSYGLGVYRSEKEARKAMEELRRQFPKRSYNLEAR